MPTAAINGTDLYFESHGSGFPLLFIHGGFGGLGTGAGGGAPAWVARFSETFEVILYDRRSSGRSGFPDTEHTMAQFADDARGVLDALGHDRAHVWGVSAGGQITLAFGLAHADAAASLVVTDSAPCLSRDETLLANLNERLRILAQDGAEAAYVARREHGTVGLDLFAAHRPAQTERDASDRAGRADAIRAQLQRVPRDERIKKYASELRTYRAYAAFDASDRLTELSSPTLVQYGTADSVFPDARWDDLTRGAAHVTYRAFEGAEHGLAVPHPESLDEIYEFLVRNTPAT